MFTSAMLQMELNDGSGAFIHHFSQDILLPLLPNNAVINESDIVVAILFYEFFMSNPVNGSLGDYTYLDGAMRLKSLTRSISNTSQVEPYSSVVMGDYQSSTTNIGHSDTVSMVCFSESTLKKSFIESLRGAGLSGDQVAQLEAMNLQEIPSVLEGFGIGLVAMPQFIKNPKLTITRVKPDDFTAVSSEYGDGSSFFDAFDLVKERVTRQESSLNSTGYAPAVYTDNGGDGSNDTIVFNGGYAMAFRYPSPTPMPDLPTIS
ncbi:hypothetical protein [Psychrobacter sp. PAMC 21119]|uniref:hypothetical protein n=1 Tax=Psychrobacter sp. PAMC 21119 TaxID=1112209 RepID=UPI000287EC1B|nr:hypothetical protein [Psychrobacter sp. PAMC 21119]